MTSEGGSAGTAGTALPVRLTLSRSSDGRLDGAWWPHSRDLGVEFAELSANLPNEFGRIVHLVYFKSSWLPAPRWLRAGTARLVRTGTFVGTADPHRVLARLDGRRTLKLMVVPPETEPGVAARAMAAASSSSNRSSASELLELVTGGRSMPTASGS